MCSSYLHNRMTSTIVSYICDPAQKDHTGLQIATPVPPSDDYASTNPYNRLRKWRTSLEIPCPILLLRPSWSEHPTLWFQKVEEIFCLADTTDGHQKFGLSALYLDNCCAILVKLIILYPPQHKHYEVLMRALICRLSPVE